MPIEAKQGSQPEQGVQRSLADGWARQLYPLLLYLVLALILTYPLVAHFASGVLGPPGDNMEYLYKLWWFKRALFDLGVSPFFSSDVFYPEGYHLALHEMSLANISLGMPMTILYGETVSYNALILSSFVLSGFGMYLLAWRLTRDRLAAFLSGVIYAFCSYRMAHLGAGHLNLLGTQWFPFLILCLEHMVITRRALAAILSGVFFALSALSSWYYAPIFLLFSALYMACRLWQLHRVRQMTERGHVLGWPLYALLAFSLAAAGLLMLPGLIPTVQQWGQRQMSFSFREVDIFSASIGDWFVPNVMHPLWGRLVAGYYTHRQDVPEHIIALSWGAIALTVAALWPGSASVASRLGRGRRFAYLLLLITSLLLGLGTTLHVGGQRLYVSVPSWVERGFNIGMGLLANRWALHPMPSYYDLRVAGAIYVPLPTLLLYLYLPFFDAMRVWTRFGLISAFATASLAGIGLRRMMRRLGTVKQGKSRGVWVGYLVLAVVLLELLPAPYALGWSEVRSQPVDRWLAQQPEGGAVIQFPLWKAECGPGLYAAATHGKPLAYGYGGFFPISYRQLRPILWEFPSAESVALLKRWGVQYVLVGANAYGAEWPDVEQRLGQLSSLQLFGEFDEQPVYHSGWLAEVLPDLRRALLVDRIYVYRLASEIATGARPMKNARTDGQSLTNRLQNGRMGDMTLSPRTSPTAALLAECGGAM